MGFFITSQGPGDGGNLGGLAGADAHCASLAAAAGSSGRTWRAYLSTQGAKLDDPNVVHARDRIGSGPWYNAKGVLIAANLTDLHLYNKTITYETALDENGNRVKGRVDDTNQHDMLTGTNEELALEILAENGYTAFTSMDEVVEKAVELAGAGA